MYTILPGILKDPFSKKMKSGFFVVNLKSGQIKGKFCSLKTAQGEKSKLEMEFYVFQTQG